MSKLQNMVILEVFDSWEPEVAKYSCDCCNKQFALNELIITSNSKIERYCKSCRYKHGERVRGGDI